MPFALEAEMIPILKTNIHAFIKFVPTGSMAIAEELPVNYRIVDLAFAAVSQDCIGIAGNGNLKTAFNKLTLMELDALSVFYMNSKKISIQKLTRHFNMETPKLKKLYLEKFLSLGLITKVSRYTYQGTDWVEFQPNFVITVEAKLKRWKEALSQASDNLRFADYSYVAIDESIILKARVINIFKESNIGLISVSESGITKILHQPRRNRRFIDSDFGLQRLRLCRDIICQNSKWSIVYK